MEKIDWLKDLYTCKCGEGISQVRTESMPKENNLWIKQVLDFNEKHKEHGFEL